MNLATIVSIIPTGKPPYESPNGTLHSYQVGFDDNTNLEVNAKSQPPPYKLGERVGYEVTGNYKGQSKGKITRNPDKFPSHAAPQMAPPQSNMTTQHVAPIGQPVKPLDSSFDDGMRSQARLYVECVLFAHQINSRLDKLGQPAMTPEHFQACVSSLYIEGNKRGLVVPLSESQKARLEAKKPVPAAPATVPESDFDPVGDNALPF